MQEKIKEIYLDNSATTRCEPEVAELVCKILTEEYGNPSSMHIMGVRAENCIKDAAKTLAGILKCKEKEIVFTSGGTEGNNLAIIGAAHAYKRSGNRIITTVIEHPAVAEPFKRLEDEGFEVVYLPVDELGLVDMDELENSLTDDTILVSVMAVNNEIGTVQPVEEIAKLIKQKSPKAVFHVDGVQAFGKIRLYPSKAGVDLYTASSHKFHGPKGVGFLFKNEKVRLETQMLGGGQQGGLRSGTDNVPGICGMALAAKLADEGLEENAKAMMENALLLAGELSKLEDVRINGVMGRIAASADSATGVENSETDAAAPHIVSVTVSGIRAEVLLHALEDRGIYVSAGSACSSHKKRVSDTLTAIGLAKKEAESTIRFSLNRYTAKEEIETAVEAMRELLPVLRQFTRH